MKLFEVLETKKTVDRLPELPEGVEVPEDISGLEAATTLKPTAGGVRWMRWLAAIVLLGGAGVVTAMLLRSDDSVETPVDYMETYGTDNPTIVDEAAEPSTVEIFGTPDLMERYGTDNPVFVLVPTSMDRYGTDNPVLVPEGTADTGESMRRYGTDNPVLVPEPTSMELYGTDNPVLVPEAGAIIVVAGESMRLYGTDNPVLVEDAAGPGAIEIVGTPDYMELYGTDNPVFVEF